MSLEKEINHGEHGDHGEKTKDQASAGIHRGEVPAIARNCFFSVLSVLSVVNEVFN